MLRGLNHQGIKGRRVTNTERTNLCNRDGSLYPKTNGIESRATPGFQISNRRFASAVLLFGLTPFRLLGQEPPETQPSFGSFSGTVSPSATTLDDPVALVRQELSAIDLSASTGQLLEKDQLEGLSLALDLTPEGRHRFILPRPSINNKPTIEQAAIAKLFPTQKAANEFRESMERIAADADRVASEAEEKSEFAEAYRHRWQAAGIRSILANTSQSWGPASALRTPKPKPKVFNNHSKTLWPAGSYAMSSTAHFDIVSQAGLKPTEELAELCEQTFAIWKQMFPEYWMSSETKAPDYSSDRNERFTVALFRDKAAYVKALKSQHRNIAISTGFYDPNRKLAMFYWDGPRTASTVVHELVHQFFSESETLPSRLDSEDGAGFLLIEGIALYMESMSVRRCGGSMIVDVGGWDALRLQSGRYRRLQNNYWIPWQDFYERSGAQLRSDPEIPQWYSQATGLTHLFMDGPTEMNRSFKSYLSSIYRGQPDVSLLGEFADETRLRKAYDSYLLTSPTKPTRPFFPSRNEAVLSRCEITSAQLLAWPVQCRSMKWLDVSFTAIDDQLFLDLSKGPTVPQTPPWNVSRLGLESSQITDLALTQIAAMPAIEELDLSGCKITDVGLKELQGNRTITTLWLNDCDVTDASVSVLQSMTDLTTLHLPGTKISSAAWSRLLNQRPGLKNKSTGP